MLRRWTTCLLATLLLVTSVVALAQTDQQTRIRDVVYCHKLGVALTMDVFKPAKPNGIGVVWMVSGGWRSDHSAIDPKVAAIFTSRGQTVFTVVHGTQPRFTLPEIVADIHRAVRFIRTHAAEYGVDPDRLAAAGGSAGGHLTMMMAAYGAPGDPDAKDPVDRASSAVQAAACFYPPTDFLNYGSAGVNVLTVEAMKSYWHIFGITEKSSAEERAKIAQVMSPAYGISAKTPPTLIIHGDADRLVPIQQSQLVMDKLEELRIPHKLVVKPGKAHGWLGIEKDGEQLAEWIGQHLGR